MKKIFSLLAIFFWLLPLFSCPAAQESPRVTPVVKIVKEVGPSVVNISTERVVLLQRHPQWGASGDLFDSLFKETAPGISKLKLPSLGSGVVIDKEGLILTNAHVVHKASTIFVIFSNGTKVEGKMVAFSRPFDLAIIQITPPYPLRTIELADSDQLMIGEPVIAVGNPFGLSNTVTTGVVSATKRDLYTPQGQLLFKDFIQTDAAINPGSSGGAVLNMEGKLIGLSHIMAQQAQGISFAIPANTIRDVMVEFKEKWKKQ